VHMKKCVQVTCVRDGPSGVLAEDGPSDVRNKQQQQQHTTSPQTFIANDKMLSLGVSRCVSAAGVFPWT
jgi:hypothetical protein